MQTLLQEGSSGLVCNPTALQQQLQEEKPPVSRRAFCVIRSWNQKRKQTTCYDTE